MFLTFLEFALFHLKLIKTSELVKFRRLLKNPARSLQILDPLGNCRHLSKMAVFSSNSQKLPYFSVFLLQSNYIILGRLVPQNPKLKSRASFKGGSLNSDWSFENEVRATKVIFPILAQTKTVIFLR